ncbi:hypothetical protein D477_007856 [Arthrobacter crystallopoietes BAB-32]|uniref:Uncharacterized protein n=1 Tax=Arthrobacter crystallopoietes BAB-32 TaxID=1246476 RepID=N1V0K2_9MICC|nr:hypothetical protein [Arthrobacter crystallopoietes]EMY34815.1 hypothetical protein D477_007856 [Arthrobacter crystallopoietes BAB-32]
MSTEANGPRSHADAKTEPEGSIPNTEDGVGLGAGAADSTFEPEETPEAAPEHAGAGTGPEAPEPDEAAGPAEEKDRQTRDDRGLTTDTTPSD